MGNRRANGEGCIYKQSNGKWRVVISVATGSGRKRISRVCDRRIDATAILEEMKADIRNSTAVDADKLTVGKFLDDWLKTCVAQESAANTLASYTNVVNTHISPRIGGIFLKKLNSLHVQSAISGLVSDGIGGRTCENCYVVLKVALQKAVDFGLIARNPCAQVKRPRHQPKDAAPFSLQEARTLISETVDTRWNALIVLALTTGMRQGELFGLEWESVDLDARTIRVAQQAVEISGKVNIAPTKTKSSVRTIELPQPAVESLIRHRAILLREGHAGSKWVFPAPEGGLMSRGNFRTRVWNRLLNRLEFDHRGFHNCRHTFASLAIGGGVPITVVSKQLGHANVTTTMNIYAHALATHQSAAVEKITAMFG